MGFYLVVEMMINFHNILRKALSVIDGIKWREIKPRRIF